MSLWLVRAGRAGEQEEAALENSVVTIGWNELPDLSSIKTRDGLKTLFEQTRPDLKQGAVNNYVGQVWTFLNKIQKGDLVALPLKKRAAVAIGKVAGDYEYRGDLPSDVHHTRKVEWIKTDIPRTAFDKDILYTLGAFMTVCEVKRNNAEERVRALLGGKTPARGVEVGEIDETEEELDIEQAASDQILEFVHRNFKGHALARLVDATLKAQGYFTKVSEPGPDGGVDILAGAGHLGFDKPHLVVQVKSSSEPVDVTVLRNLQGVVKSFGAEEGLLVCWGGYKRSVTDEARRSFFTVRLWDSGDLLAAVFQNYEKFPEDLQAELPLKKIWSLVLEE